MMKTSMYLKFLSLLGLVGLGFSSATLYDFKYSHFSDSDESPLKVCEYYLTEATDCYSVCLAQYVGVKHMQWMVENNENVDSFIDMPTVNNLANLAGHQHIICRLLSGKSFHPRMCNGVICG